MHILKKYISQLVCGSVFGSVLLETEKELIWKLDYNFLFNIAIKPYLFMEFTTMVTTW